MVTDDAGGPTPDVHIDAPVRVITVGNERDNQAIAALAVRADPAGLKRTLFVSVANYTDAIVSRRLQILADGAPVSARDLAAGRPEPLGRGHRRAAAGRARGGGAAAAGAGQNGAPLPAAADLLPIDDRAWAVVPDDRVRRVLLVGPGNVYLQNALSLLPNVELYGATPDEWASTTGKDRFDLVVFDGFLPDELPDKPILAIAPPRTSRPGRRGRHRGEPDRRASSPRRAAAGGRGPDAACTWPRRRQCTLPDWARTVHPSGADVPLLYSGLRSGLPTRGARLRPAPERPAAPGGLADPGCSNLAGELLGTGRHAPTRSRPPSPVELALRPGVDGLHVTLPDGIVRGDDAGRRPVPRRVTFVDTASSASTGWRRSPARRLAERRRPAAGDRRLDRPSRVAAAVGRGVVAAAAEDRPCFAVDLFSADGSNIAPGDGSAPGGAGHDRRAGPGLARPARDDWWPPLVG